MSIVNLSPPPYYTPVATITTEKSIVKNTFDPHSIRWSWPCCGCCFPTNQAIAVGIVQLILVVISVALRMSIGSIVGAALLVAVIACLIVGIKMKIPGLLFIHFIFELITAVILFGVAIYAAAALTIQHKSKAEQLLKPILSDYEQQRHERITDQLYPALLLYFGGFLLHAWFAIIVFKAFAFIRAQNRYERESMVMLEVQAVLNQTMNSS